MRQVAIDLTAVEFISIKFTPIIIAPPLGLSSRSTLPPLGHPRHIDFRLCRMGADMGEYVSFSKSISFSSVLRYRSLLGVGVIMYKASIYTARPIGNEN